MAPQGTSVRSRGFHVWAVSVPNFPTSPAALMGLYYEFYGKLRHRMSGSYGNRRTR